MERTLTLDSRPTLDGELGVPAQIDDERGLLMVLSQHVYVVADASVSQIQDAQTDPRDLGGIFNCTSKSETLEQNSALPSKRRTLFCFYKHF